MERDLGEFRSKQKVHLTDSLEFHDDTLMLKLNGPRTTAEFDGGVGDARQALTPFSRECASLWRELVGQRRGHYNPKATVAAKVSRKAIRGTATGAFRGVLSAARLAVASARLRSGRGLGRVRDLHEGAGTSASALWTESMGRFQARSRNNIPGCTQTRTKPGGAFVHPAGVHLQQYRGAKRQPLAQVQPCCKVAFLVGDDVQPVQDLVIVEGRHRCATADIVVLPDLAVLHVMEKLVADLDLAVCFLYIVSRGLQVTTTSRLLAAGGRAKNIPMRHRAFHLAAMQTRAVFHVGADIQEQRRDVYRALRRLADMPSSKIQLAAVVPASGGGHAVIPASGGGDHVVRLDI